MTTLGIIVGNRGFFPSELCKEGRQAVLDACEQAGLNTIALSEQDTDFGSVESYQDAQKCAELFKKHRDQIDGILVTLPNFGDERGVADAIRLSGLDVPILVHAHPDNNRLLDGMHRRDSFCGKISVCNNLKQYGIPFSLTASHTVAPASEVFAADLNRFRAVCDIVRGLKNARFGHIGARPAAFNTVRYSEKLLEQSGMTVVTIDLSEIVSACETFRDADTEVKQKREEIDQYAVIKHIPDDSLSKMARLGVVLDRLIREQGLSGLAIQCWTALQTHYGVMPCTVMSMLSDSLISSACETDIPGMVAMQAMALASGKPSAILDWNNNFDDDPDKVIVFHCSNLPSAVFDAKPVMEFNEIIAKGVGKEKTYGTVTGTMKPAPVTYCRVSTDDQAGCIKAYVGEGEVTNDRVESFGGYGVCRIPRMQNLLQYICENGFEHHVAISPSSTATAVHEAFGKYLRWDTYWHDKP